jgi:hypothetical protein
MNRPHSLRHRALITLMAATLAFSPWAARAQSDLSETSALSVLPVALVVAAPALLLSGGAQLSVAGVQAVGEGTVWVLERASDGARMSLKLSGKASAAAGQSVLVTAVAAGWILSVAGAAVAFVPNEIGRRLMHDEQLSR